MKKQIEIVINADYGGFEVSKAVYDELGIKWDGYGFIRNENLGIKSKNPDAYRADKRLIDAIKKIGLQASNRVSSLKIVKIPADVDWQIEEYDGLEWISEKHRTWGLSQY